MAHQISFGATGKAEIAYVGATPWHGLGTNMGPDLKTIDEMLTAAGLRWVVGTEPLYLADSAPVPGYVAIRRQDTRIVLGVASARYAPIQNTQAADVLDALVTEGGAHVEVMGALDDGRMCWALARLPESFDISRGDLVNPYILLCWGHDGKHGLAAKLTMVRVICANTLGQAMGAKWSRTADVYLRHTKSAVLRIDDARRALGLVKRNAEQTADAYRLLAATKLEAPAAYFETIFPQPAPMPGLTTTTDPSLTEKLARWEAHQAEVVALYQGKARGADLPGVGGTVWGGYNAVSEWIDHSYPVLKSGEVSRIRQQSVLFGSYGDTKARALALGLDLAGAGA